MMIYIQKYNVNICQLICNLMTLEIRCYSSQHIGMIKAVIIHVIVNSRFRYKL